MTIKAVEATATGSDQWTDWIAVKGDFNLSIGGSWTGIAWVQRRFGSTERDVKSYTENTEKAGYEPEGAEYRAGFKSGGHTGGSAVFRLSY